MSKKHAESRSQQLSQMKRDEPYRAGCSIYTHPSQIAAIAALHHVNTPALDRPRVLELGTAAGENLLAIAATLPESECVGVELDAALVQEAQRAASEAQLDHRLQFITGDATRCGTGAPFDRPFDFIIAHGLFSWIPAAYQPALLDECARLLAPEGLLYLSYNCFPGWHQLMPWRRLMRLHLQEGGSIAHARHAMSRFAELGRSQKKQEAHLKQLLELEGNLAELPDFYFAHEHLLDENHPVYFIEVARGLRERGLAYVGDAQLNTDQLPHLLSERQRQLLTGLNHNDPLLDLQHIDLLFNIGFRRSIWRRGEEIAPPLDHEALGQLELSSPYAPAALLGEHSRSLHQLGQHPSMPWDPKQPTRLYHRYNEGAQIDLSGEPLLYTALSLLAFAWPASQGLDQLYRDCEALLGEGAPQDEAAWARLSRQLFSMLQREQLPPPRFAPLPALKAEGACKLNPTFSRGTDGRLRGASLIHEQVNTPPISEESLRLLLRGGERAALHADLVGELGAEGANLLLSTLEDLGCFLPA